MSLSSTFEKMKTKQYHLTAKERLLVVVAIGLTAIIITSYATTSEVAVNSSLPGDNSQLTANPPNKSVVPMGTQMIPVNPDYQTMRDPFAKPPEAKELKNDTGGSLPFVQNNIPSHVSDTMPNPSIPHENLRLTGIVGNADQRLAVIMLASKSKSYKLNDHVGAYKLTDISKDAIILTDANHTLVLHLELNGQKGGISGAK